MKNKRLFQTIAGISLLAVSVAAGVSLAWLSPSARIGYNGKTNAFPIDGSSSSSYFAYGNGQLADEQHPKNRPYGIKTPRHLYNLAWLQYLGYFENKQLYFELADDIDMTGWVLPPIGTEDNPFISQFNGNGYVVSNLTVTNSFSDFNNKNHPTTVNASTFVEPNIIGFFGVVGPTEEEPGYPYNSATNQLIDFGLTGITVKTSTASSLVGIAAGYVNGTLENVAVDASTINVSTSTTSALDYTDNISDYGVVGYCTDAYKQTISEVTESVYDVSVTDQIKFNARESGQATGWGGSVDMKTVYERLLAIRGTRPNTAAYTYRVTNSHHPDNTTTTENTQDGGGNVRLINNSDYSHFMFTGTPGGNNSANYVFLGGGHWQIDKYYDYAPHTGRKITDGNGHYLTVSSFNTNANNNNNAGTLSNVDDTNPKACLWTVPTSATGYISTDYYYDSDGANPTTYYLYVYNENTLRLGTGTNRTLWNRSVDENGKVRYVYGNYYLGYANNAWRLIELPTAPTYPTDPSEFIPEEPTAPEQPALLDESDYASALTYQIAYTNNGVTYYLCPTSTHGYTTSTIPSTYGWGFSSLSNRSNSQLTTRISNTTYYASLTRSNGRPRTYSFTLGTSTQTVYIRTQSSAGQTLYRISNSNENSYLNFNTTSNTFSATANYTNLQVITTTAAISNYNSDLESQYDNLYEDYLNELEQYEEDLEYYEYYRDVLYGELLEQYDIDLENYNIAMAATYNLNSTQQTTATGPDEKLDSSRTISEMNYESNDVTYFPLTTESDNLTPATNNTAYVVGGSPFTENSGNTSTNYSAANVRFANGYRQSNNLLSDFNRSANDGDGEFEHIYTIVKNGNTLSRVDIVDETEQYSKLQDAKDSMCSILCDNTGTDEIYGVHFMDAAISKSAVTKAKKAKFNNHEYTDFEMPVNSIDFQLKEFGYINFMAGTYYSYDGGNDSFFSLFQIERNYDTSGNPSNLINRILKIENIYKYVDANNQTPKNYSYVYELVDADNASSTHLYTRPYKLLNSQGDKQFLDDPDAKWIPNSYLTALPSNYVKVFDVDVIEKNSLSNFDNHPFYFEIPMNDGEFCLGSVNGGNGAYLMYLDIGSNAAETQRTQIIEHFTSSVKTYEYPLGISLIKPSAVTTANADGTQAIVVDALDTAIVCIEVGYSGNMSLTRSGTSNDDVTLTRTDTSASSKAKPVYVSNNISLIHDSGGDTNIEVVPLSSTTTDIQRLQYYDWNVSYGSLTRTVITDTSVNGGTYTRTVEQYKVDSATGTETAVKTADIRVYDGSNGVRILNPEDRSVLSFSSTTETIILQFKYSAESATVTRTLLMQINESGSTTAGMRCYSFAGYKFTIDTSGTTTKVYILKLGTTTGTLTIGTTPVTTEGQVITIS